MVKMAFLVPEISVLFIIPMGCGRHGGIATMREGLAGNLSYLPIAEVDIVTGNHLAKVEQAVGELIDLESPKGLMLFTTCIDDLLGSDYDSLLTAMESKHGVPIVRAKMNPIMALSKRPPTMMIYNSIHGFLTERPRMIGQFNVIGTPCPIDSESEIHEIFQGLGLPPLRHIGQYKSFEDHLQLAEATVNLLIAIPGLRAAESLEKRLGQDFLKCYSMFRPEGIRQNYDVLEDYLDCEIETISFEQNLKDCIASYKPDLLGKKAVIGANIQGAPFELARFLTELGMSVRYIIAGFVLPHDREHLPWLSEHAPDLQVIPSLEPSLSLVREPVDSLDFGIGLDSPAYFEVDRLVDISPDENLYGYRGSMKLIKKIAEAPKHRMDIKDLVYSQNLVI
jgi:nitrogenase molybdenum-cofactor synthesis protein NifE